MNKIPSPTSEWIVKQYSLLSTENKDKVREFLKYLLETQNDNKWLLPLTRAIKVYIESHQGAMVDNFWIAINELVKIHSVND